MGKILDACADFETITDPTDCRVWAWGFAYINFPDTVEMGEDITDFIDRIEGEKLRVYFHNLKFDGTFIMDWLLKNGYTHTVDDWRPGTFKTLISKLGQHYSIHVKWHNGMSTQFRDSFKKLPMKVAEVARSFGLAIRKGEIDYHKPRPYGYRMDDNEREYMHNDVSIMAHALAQVIAEGLTRLTVGADALAEFKSLTPKFDRLFPVLGADIDADIRSAYKGGFTYAAKRYQGIKHDRHGFTLDVNSLYPYVMYAKPLPYGEPTYYPTRPDFIESEPLSIFQVTFTAKLKDKHIPVIQLKNNFRFSATEYLEEISEPVTLNVTNIDWELYQEHYDIDVEEYGPAYTFKAATGMFNDYIDKWSTIKATSTGGRRQLAKLQLNSLYGKFATSTDITGKYPVLFEDRVKLVQGDEETRDPVYTAAGVFITAHARYHTISAAQANYDSFAYADTDSLHLLTDTLPDGLDIDANRMGAWALEYEFTESFFMRAKAYMERKTDGTLETHIAGVPTHLSGDLNFSDMRDGKVIKGKLIPKNVPGGVVLQDIDYVLKM